MTQFILPLILAIAITLVAIIWVQRGRVVTIVYPPNIGLLYRDGVFQRELPPGRYSRFDPFRRARVVNISLAELPLQFGEITVLSKDQFSFRLGLALVLRIDDARAYGESQNAIEPNVLAAYMPAANPHASLHTLLSAAALAVVAERVLTEMLSDAPGVAAAIHARMASAVSGATVENVLLTSLNLPPETRKMFTEVERAKFEALASLERARGEQASLRVLANAARLVKDNPSLANLRLLQAIEKGKGQTTLILGSASSPIPGLAYEPAPGTGSVGEGTT
jgi:regulator of protease activity HflC (stomatin/prohibitin superfamily)